MNLETKKNISSYIFIRDFISATVKKITIYQKSSDEIVLIAEETRIFYIDDQNVSITKSLDMTDLHLAHTQTRIIAAVNTYAGRTFFFFPDNPISS